MNPLLQKAYQLREAGQPDEAARICSDVLNDEPHNVEALFCYGLLLISVERFGMACNVMERRSANVFFWPPVHEMPTFCPGSVLSSERHCVTRSGSATRYGLPLNSSSLLR